MPVGLLDGVSEGLSEGMSLGSSDGIPVDGADGALDVFEVGLLVGVSDE